MRAYMNKVLQSQIATTLVFQCWQTLISTRMSSHTSVKMTLLRNRLDQSKSVQWSWWVILGERAKPLHRSITNSNSERRRKVMSVAGLMRSNSGQVFSRWSSINSQGLSLTKTTCGRKKIMQWWCNKTKTKTTHLWRLPVCIRLL